MRTVLSAIGIVIAAAFCAGTPQGAITMSSTTSTAQDAGQAFTLRPLAIGDPRAIDGLRLVERKGEPTLLFSTQVVAAGQYELVIRAAPLADVRRVTEVARIERILPVPPRWDARPAGDAYEIVYEMAGGAINAVLFQDAHGSTTRVSVEHPFESFSRPHFVRDPNNVNAANVGAIADLKKVVVFLGGTARPVKYEALADGADGVVVGNTNRRVVAKSVMSGPALFDTLPGRLTILRAGRGPLTVPDFLAYELDAAPIADDVVVFATSKPALVIDGRRPEQPYRLNAENRSWLLQLSRPAILVTSQLVHLAAIANPRSDQAVVLYGAVPIAALAQ